jgi:hypothetical protein
MYIIASIYELYAMIGQDSAYWQQREKVIQIKRSGNGQNSRRNSRKIGGEEVLVCCFWYLIRKFIFVMNKN